MSVINITPTYNPADYTPDNSFEKPVIVVLDAGHGMVTKGKQTPEGIKEWSITNDIANMVAINLDSYNVIIHRTDDAKNNGATDVPLLNRTKLIKKLKPNVVLSLHCNANTGIYGTWSGYEVYYMKDNDQLCRKATIHLAYHLGKPVDGRVIPNHGYPVKTKNLHMLRETPDNIPALLYEFGYMDSINDNPYLMSKAGRQNCANAVCDLLLENFGIMKKPEVCGPKTYVDIINESRVIDKKGWLKLISDLDNHSFDSDRFYLLKSLGSLIVKIRPKMTYQQAIMDSSVIQKELWIEIIDRLQKDTLEPDDLITLTSLGVFIEKINNK